MHQRRPDGCTPEVWAKASCEGDEEDEDESNQLVLPAITLENFANQLTCDCVASCSFGMCAHKLLVAHNLEVYDLTVQAGELKGNNRSAKPKGRATFPTGALTAQPETPKKASESGRGRGKGKGGKGKGRGKGGKGSTPLGTSRDSDPLNPKKRQRTKTPATRVTRRPADLLTC